MKNNLPHTSPTWPVVDNIGYIERMGLAETWGMVELLVLNDDGRPFMGSGPIRLLQGVERLGSINQATNEMRMSYMKALKIIKKIETCRGGKILKTTIGGKDYGGSKLRHWPPSFSTFLRPARQRSRTLLKSNLLFILEYRSQKRTSLSSNCFTTRNGDLLKKTPDCSSIGCICNLP